jgi:membrane protein DedA with SNARE-associated domain
MIREIIQAAWLPLFLFAIYVLFLAVYLSIGLPSPQDILHILQEAFERHGMVVVFGAAVLESIFMISFYFPGSIVIVLSVLVSGGDLDKLISIGLLCWLGFSLGMVINYCLGYFGFYKALLAMGHPDIVVNTKKWLDKRGTLAAFLTGFHPNFLAIVAVCFGLSKMSFWKAITTLVVILAFWVPIAVLIALLLIRTVSVADDSQHYYVAAMFLVWALVQMGSKYFELIRRKIY